MPTKDVVELVLRAGEAAVRAVLSLIEAGRSKSQVLKRIERLEAEARGIEADVDKIADGG